MDFDKDEKEIRDLFKGRPLKKVPEDLLKNYEAEVLRKIRSGPKGILFGVQVSFALALAAILMVAVFYFTQARPKTATPTAEPEPIALSEPTSSSPKSLVGDPESSDVILRPKAEEPQDSSPVVAEVEASEDALFEELADELLLLEMLGEDEGILPDDQTAADFEVFPTPAF